LDNSPRNETQQNLSDIFQAQEKQFEMLREMIEAGFAKYADPLIKDLPESFIIYMDSVRLFIVSFHFLLLILPI